MKQITLITTIFIMLLWGCGNKPKKQRVAYTDYDRGYSFLYYENYDSAFMMFNSYVVNADDSLNKGKAYRYMGEMLWRIGDLYGAQEKLANAVHVLNLLDAKQLIQAFEQSKITPHTLDSLDSTLRQELGAAYNISGNVHLELKLYDEAIDDYNKGIVVLKGSDYRFEPMNGKATTFQKKGNFTNAIAVYDSIIALNPEDQQQITARAIDNKAKTKWLQDPGYPALPEFWSALKIRVDNVDTAGLNASYAHLSDYYVKLKPDSALVYAQKMFKRAKENKNPADMVEAIDKLVNLNNSSSLKQFWYTEFRKISDSLQYAKDTTKYRFASIKLDLVDIKADNLALQKHINWQRIFMFVLAALAAVIISVLSFWFGKRRRQIKQESENAIRESKLKTSQKVHDVVANGLYRIMNELEHGKTMDKEPLLDKIEILYERSRDISYEHVSPVNTADHSKQVDNSLMIFNNEQTKLSVAGNEPAFWNRFTAVQKQELQLVLDEIMVNMKKHSEAKNASISFKQENDLGLITYKDDGVGFPPGFSFGNGLTNTVNRIKSLKGDVTFGKSGESGVLISISLPL